MADDSDHHRNLRGHSFVEAQLDGASFVAADLRGADFTGASLVGADFRGARFGVPPGAGALYFVLALVIVAAAGWLTGWTLSDLLDEVQSSEWERLFGATLAGLVFVVFIGGAIVGGLRSAVLTATLTFGAALAVNYVVLALASGRFDLGRDARVISLLLLLGASMIAGGLARVVGGVMGPVAIVIVALSGGFAAGRAGGGIAGLLVSVLLVALAKRTLRRDPRDQLAYDVVHRIVSRRSTRFVGADLSEADISSTGLAFCDTTGATLQGTALDPAVDHRRNGGTSDDS